MGNRFVRRITTRTAMTIGAAVLLAAALAYTFWPRAMPVDIGEVRRGAMTVTIDEEARTRVRDSYVVSAPISGRLLRVEVRSGDIVEGGRSVIARMLPTNVPALDVRTLEQARAAVAAAEAALQATRAELQKAIAERDYAEADLERKRQLAQRGVGSEAALDEAKRAHRSALAALDVAKATIAVREADLAKARAQMITFEAPRGPLPFAAPSQLGAGEQAMTIPITAPISGRILRVIQESETTVAAGAAILEIGDTSNDLEIVAELLSTDAVKVDPGDPVAIRKWGGEETLSGIVERVEPWGFTKVSALGVEEQRVRAVIRFTDPPERRRTLGHGFRVEVRINIWEDMDTVVIPSSAVFRRGDSWATFLVENRRARRVPVEIGRNNGVVAQVLGGLEAGTRVVLYPSPSMSDGQRIVERHVE